MKYTYYNFPLVKFCQIAADESRLKEFGISKENWEEVKEEYQRANPSQEAEMLLEAYRKVLKAVIQSSKTIALLKYIMAREDGQWEEYFKAANIKYTGDYEKDLKYLQTQIKKHKTNEEVFRARLDSLEEEIEKKQKENISKKMDVSKIYRVMSSLEALGANIPDYEKFTCGQNDAWTETIRLKNKKK